MQTESQTNSSNYGFGLLNKLLQTHPALKELPDIRRAQLVMVFSLVLELSGLVGLIGLLVFRRDLIFAWAIIFAIDLLCLAAYGIGRTRYYKLGAWLIITTIASAGYLLFASGSSQTPTTTLFIMLPIALTLSAGLLSVTEQVVFLVANVVFVAILPLFSSLIANTLQYAAILLALGVLLLIVSAFRNRLENEQFVEMTIANRELRAVRDNLEELVRIGTESAEKARSETAAALYTLQEQAWLLNAQVSLAEALRGEQNLSTLANRAMQAVCSELKSPIGAFFLFDDNQLKFTGGFAYFPNEQNPVCFQLGEGLVGQAAVDRRKIFLKNIPDGYFEIVSGLGSTLPNQLAILPCVYSRKLVGVIELGLLTGLSQMNLQFIDAAVENISVAIQTANDRLRISELLAETQAQAEELQSREEELRAINEELEAQAESLRQSSDRA